MTATAIGLVGVVLVSAAVTFVDEATPFPGLAALAPCLGALLLIQAGPAGLVGAVLRTPPLVILGRVSYSLYLWHWPVMVFAGYYALDGLTWPARIGLICLSLALAFLSWRFVEQPFRRHQGSARRDFGVAAALVCVFVATGASLILTQGAPQRFSASVLDLLPPPILACPDAKAVGGRLAAWGAV